MRVPESHRGARSNVEEEGGWFGRMIGRRDPNVRRDIILLASIVAVCLLFGFPSSFRNTSIATTTGVRRAVGRSGDDDDNVADSQIRNISSLDDGSSVHLPPLIIDVAAGSTGTRTLYKILCKLGFVGVHHRCYCNAFLEPVLRDMLYPISGSHAIKKDGSQSMESETFYAQKCMTKTLYADCPACIERSSKLDQFNILKGLGAHRTLSATVYDMTVYRDGDIDMSAWPQTRESSTAVLLGFGAGAHSSRAKSCDGRRCCCASLTQTLKTNIDVLVRSGVEVLSDFPYPEMTDYIMESAARAGREVIILFTERDPKEWVIHRVRHNALSFPKRRTGIVHCNDTSMSFGALIACLEAHAKSDSKSTKDVFVAMTDIADRIPNIGEATDSDIADSMKEYTSLYSEHQAKYASRAAWRINFFKQKERISDEKLMKMLMEILPPPTHHELLPWWNGKTQE